MSLCSTCNKINYFKNRDAAAHGNFFIKIKSAKSEQRGDGPAVLFLRQTREPPLITTFIGAIIPTTTDDHLHVSSFLLSHDGSAQGRAQIFNGKVL